MTPRVDDAPHAAAGRTGQFFRLPRHNRSVCCAIEEAADPARLCDSDVIVFKGTEPLLDDFADYLQWMMGAPFRGSEAPVGLHFPLVLKMPPGAMPIDECRREQRVTTAVHAAHVKRYGQLARAPVPLFVHELSRVEVDGYLEEARCQLMPQAFERIEGRACAGLGVEISYYPAAPIRVVDLGEPPIRRMLGRQGDASFTDGTNRRWAESLALGYMPYVPWNNGWGSPVDMGNACVDGGFSDLLTLTPFASIPSPRLFHASLHASLEIFAQTVATLCASLDLAPAGRVDPLLVARVHAYLRPMLVRHLHDEDAASRVDPRLLSHFEIESLDELLRASLGAKGCARGEPGEEVYGSGREA